jgi:hypothetical protein
MSANELRQAAETLRTRAAAASTGPWESFVLGSEGYAVVADRPETERRRSRIRVARFGWEDWDTDKANAHWVATMHPGVGLALADWLDLTAHRIERVEDSGNFTPELLLSMCEQNVLGFTPALQIARLINGGAA